MSLNRRDGLASELSMIEAMLRQIPRGRVIERIGLEGRAAELREEIEGLGPGPRTIALTFRGAPVDGSRAIVADFAGKALAAFSDAVGTLVASITGELAESGPLSGSPERSLRVLGPALGSFGFEIELPEPAIDRQVTIFDPQGQDPYEAAIQEAIALVSAAQGDDEESLAERVSSVHPRALAKVREFIDLLTKREASFALRADHLRVEVQDVDAARRIAGALADNDITRAAGSLARRSRRSAGSSRAISTPSNKQSAPATAPAHALSSTHAPEPAASVTASSSICAVGRPLAARRRSSGPSTRRLHSATPSAPSPSLRRTIASARRRSSA
jgi:hypothetical protein